MANKNIYECDLLSITKDMIVDPLLSKEENINQASTMLVKVVLVQRIDDNHFREIITGKKIPASIIVRSKNTISYQLTSSPIFIKYKKYNYDTEEDDLKIASIFSINSYEKKHGNKQEYLEELEYLFDQAATYYRDASKKSKAKGPVKIKSLFNKFKS